MKQRWEQETVIAGGAPNMLDALVTQAKQRGAVNIADPRLQIAKIIPLALTELTHRKTFFSIKDLLFEVKALSILSVPTDHLVERAIEAEIAKQELIHIGNGRFTTKTAVMLEHANISCVVAQKQTCNAMVAFGSDFLSNSLLQANSEKTALKILLNSTDRFIAINQPDESALHRVLQAFNISTIHAKKYVVSIKRELAEDFAVKLAINNGSSFSGFIAYTNKIINEPRLASNIENNHIWFVLRSHMLTVKQLRDLQVNALALNARVIFIGDHMQRANNDFGAPFRAMLENQIEQVSLNTKDNGVLSLLRSERAQAAIKQLINHGHLVELDDQTNRLHEAAKFAVENQGNLITQNSIDKHEANIEIRSVMQEQQQLTGKVYKAQILVPVFLTATQKTSVASFQIGDLLRFNNTITNSPYKQGQYFEIVDLDHDAQVLLLENHNKQGFALHLDPKVAAVLAVYRRQIRELQIGDHVVWNDLAPRKLQPNLEFSKSYAKVAEINQELTLVLPSGKFCKLDLSQFKNQHLEYGYSYSLKECTKKEFNKAAVLLNTSSYPTITLTDLYTTLNAIKGQQRIFCNNIEKFTQKVLTNPGSNEHAYLQKAVAYTKSVQNGYFSAAIGALDGTLARHHDLLAKIVPEIELNTQNLQLPKTQAEIAATAAVDFAIAKLSEREATFKKQALLDLAMQYNIKAKPADVAQVVNIALANNVIIEAENGILITKEVYAMECACLKIQKQGEGALTPIIAGPNIVLDQIKNHKIFTEAQKQAILLVITASDRINIIQGVAGAGKTTMLKEVKALSRDAGFEVLGLAITASAKNTLHSKTTGDLYHANDQNTFIYAGIHSQTLASFVIQTEKLIAADLELAKETFGKNTLFVLDEASLVAARDMFAFVNIVEQLDARAVIVGDDRQLPAIEASRVFKLMLGKSNSYVAMNINTRLKTASALSVMQDIYATRIDDAFDKLFDNIVEIPDRNERLSAMANYYLGAKPIDRSEIMPMLPLNADRVQFNELVRAGLKKEGTLTGQEIKTTILVPKDLTHPERTYALGFAKGDWVRFNHNIARLGINKGDYLLVEGSNHERVILRDRNNNRTGWEPARFAAYFKGAVEVYTAELRGLMIGDEIRWRRNDETRGIINSETARVVAVKDNYAKVQLNLQQIITLDLSKKTNQHWDHAYGATVHVVQGLDRRNPIGHGIGGSLVEKSLLEVKQGDQVVMPQTVDATSKVCTVMEMGKSAEGKPFIKVRDRFEKNHTITTTKVSVFPNFGEGTIPKISSLESFLVMATRGDELVMFVDNIDLYKAALKANQDLKRTALEMMLPKTWEQIKTNVAAITGTVYGLANTEEMNDVASKKNHAEIKINNLNESARRSNSKSKLKTPSYDLATIKNALENDILSYATVWRGEPTKKTSREARWGMHGSFSVVLAGSKRGAWADFEAGAAGKDLVSLYMHTYNLSKIDFPKALEELAALTCVSMQKFTHKIMKAQNKEHKTQEEAKNKAEYINRVTKLYEKTVPIDGTLAEVYLRKFRNIQCKLPADFRFQARCWHDELKKYLPALIVPGYDPAGKLQVFNRIYLNKDGSKITAQFKDSDGKLQNATAKRNYGPTSGTTIMVNKSTKPGITFVTEGLENALTIKQAQPYAEVLASFGVGQLKNLNISSQTNTIVLCADNDGLATNSKGPMLEAISKWLEQGYQVKLALPFGDSSIAKYDFNDLLNHSGTIAVINCLKDSLPISKTADLGTKTTALSQDFLKLQESKEYAKSMQAEDLKNNQKIINQQMQHGFER